MGLPEILAVAFMAAIAYFLYWRWWLRPLIWAIQARQWGWVAAMVFLGWWAGLFYLAQRKVETITVANPFLFTKGDTMMMSGQMYRVLAKNGDRLTVLCLGDRRSTVGA